MRAGTYSISSGFGPRPGGFHAGLDFAAKDGTPFYACQDGTVQYIGAADGYGQWIVVDSDDDQGAGCVEYGHMWDAFKTGLRVGSRVTAGQLIGYVGSNGQSSGPHLHISVWPRGYGQASKIDPALWLRGAGHPGAPAPTPSPRPAAPNPAPGGTMPNKPAFREINMLGSNRSNRFGARPTLALGHTEEGSSTAVQLANSLNNRDDASYHDVIRDGIVVHLVDKNYASWSVLDANGRSMNYCFAGSRAAWSREQWLQRRGDIRIWMWLVAEDIRRFPSLGSRVQGRPYPLGNVPCVADHYFVTHVLGIGSHTDLGPNFPFDVAAADLREFLTGVPAMPPVNQINLEADRAKAWIGKRITNGENACPDGKGRWAEFENGRIYFSPATGAHAIPNYIFETWAQLKWETGILGYPTGDHTILPDGEVQGFERGAIYRKGHPGKNEHPGWPIVGDIRAHWNRSGFENGQYGWPVGGEVVTRSGARWQQFEKGRLIWSPDKVIGLVPQDGPDIIN